MNVEKVPLLRVYRVYSFKLLKRYLRYLKQKIPNVVEHPVFDLLDKAESHEIVYFKGQYSTVWVDRVCFLTLATHVSYCKVIGRAKNRVVQCGQVELNTDFDREFRGFAPCLCCKRHPPVFHSGRVFRRELWQPNHRDQIIRSRLISIDFSGFPRRIYYGIPPTVLKQSILTIENYLKRVKSELIYERRITEFYSE